MKQLPHDKYDGYRGIGIRLNEPLLSDVAYENVEDDTPFIKTYHAFDKSHVLMLGENNIIPQKDAQSILKELRYMDKKGVEEIRSQHGWGLHSGEHYLIRKLGYDVGGRIHLARSSGDLGQVRVHVFLRDQILQTIPLMIQVEKTLIEFAIKHRKVIVPESTHGLHAQVTTLGAYALMWAEGLHRDIDRFCYSYKYSNSSPAGSAIGTGSPFPVNRKRTAELLGFDDVRESTLDAILGTDDSLLQVYSNLAILCSHTGRWADDLAFFYSDDMLLIDLPDRFCHTSSIMMHKKNPVALEHMRSSTATAIGSLTGAFSASKSKTGPAESGMSTIWPISLQNIFNLARRDLTWLTTMLPDITIREQYVELKSKSRWATATEIAATIVKEKGYSWRIAHQCVGTLVRLAEERNINSQDTTSELLDEAAIEYFGKPIGLTKNQYENALNPLNSVLSRQVEGGPHPEHTLSIAKNLTNSLTDQEKWLEEKLQLLKDSEIKLNKEIDNFILKGES